MERHFKNAMAAARFLEADPRVERVIFPGDLSAVYFNEHTDLDESPKLFTTPIIPAYVETCLLFYCLTEKLVQTNTRSHFFSFMVYGGMLQNMTELEQTSYSMLGLNIPSLVL